MTLYIFNIILYIFNY